MKFIAIPTSTGHKPHHGRLINLKSHQHNPALPTSFTTILQLRHKVRLKRALCVCVFERIIVLKCMAVNRQPTLVLNRNLQPQNLFKIHRKTAIRSALIAAKSACSACQFAVIPGSLNPPNPLVSSLRVVLPLDSHFSIQGSSINYVKVFCFKH